MEANIWHARFFFVELTYVLGADQAQQCKEYEDSDARHHAGTWGLKMKTDRGVLVIMLGYTRREYDILLRDNPIS